MDITSVTIDLAIKTFSAAREAMNQSLAVIQGIVKEEIEDLYTNHKDALPAILTEHDIIVYKNRGRVTKANDRSQFFWTGITVDDGYSQRDYLIDFFFNEIDASSGNPHTQMGRVQFCALRPGGKSPHEYHRIGENAILEFNRCRLRDSGQSIVQYNSGKPELQPLNVKRLIKAFLQFVAECEEGIVLEGKSEYVDISMLDEKD